MQAFFEFLVLVGGTPKRKPHGAESQKGRVREDAEQLPDIGQYAPEGFSDPVAGNGNPTNTTNVCLFACIQRFGGYVQASGLDYVSGLAHRRLLCGVVLFQKVNRLHG
jgi:hypothetical protein